MESWLGRPRTSTCIARSSMTWGNWFKLPLTMVYGKLDGKAGRTQASACIPRPPNSSSKGNCWMLSLAMVNGKLAGKQLYRFSLQLWWSKGCPKLKSRKAGKPESRRDWARKVMLDADLCTHSQPDPAHQNKGGGLDYCPPAEDFEGLEKCRRHLYRVIQQILTKFAELKNDSGCCSSPYMSCFW